MFFMMSDFCSNFSRYKFEKVTGTIRQQKVLKVPKVLKVLKVVLRSLHKKINILDFHTFLIHMNTDTKKRREILALLTFVLPNAV